MATNGGLLPNAYSSRSNLLNSFRSSFAPGNWDLNSQCTFVTCGDSLRGLNTITTVDPFFNGGLPFDTYVVPAIYTNMQDFSKDLLTDACGAIGIEKTGIGTDTLVAEDLNYFFDDSDDVIADLGTNIVDFEMADFNDFRGSSIVIGQPDEQFDSINGPLETNSNVTYVTPSTRTIKAIDHTTPYRADPYGTEYLRANIGNKTNTNSSSDNDTVKLQVTGVLETPVTVLGNWTGLSGYEMVVNALLLDRARIADGITSGLPADLLTPTVDPYGMYNYQFTPKRKALRALPWLCSNYRGMVNSLMGITAYKKNIKVVSDLGSGPITESDWINVSDTPQTYIPPFSTTPITVNPAPIPAGRTTALIFKPHTFAFTGPAIKNLPLLMTPPGTPGGGKMYRKIKFTFQRGNKQYPLAGFVLDVGITPGSNSAYNYFLLCGPRVDIPDDL